MLPTHPQTRISTEKGQDGCAKNSGADEPHATSAARHCSKEVQWNALVAAFAAMDLVPIRPAATATPVDAMIFASHSRSAIIALHDDGSLRARISEGSRHSLIEWRLEDEQGMRNAVHRICVFLDEARIGGAAVHP
jgi:hypothetical protein